MSELRITDVRATAVGFSREPATLNANLVSPTSAFDDHVEKGRRWWGPAVTVIVEVETDAGIVGVGSAGGFSAAPKSVIEHHFRDLVLGEDPFDVELIWAKLYRASVRFGRAGTAIAALSAIDIACWDIMGRALRVPVFELLGGRAHSRVPVYVSRLYALEDLDELADEARRWQAEGFTMMKQRFGFGPRDGVAGMRRNEQLIRTVREAVGDDVVLAADAYMGWDLHYALEMERRLRPYGLRWIEEPLMPHDIAGYARLCRESTTLISSGEHAYTRYGFRELIEHAASDILQPDVNRMGGITEARKVFALAAAHDIPVVPHSNEAHNLHLVTSQLNAPFAEYFPDVEPDTGNELFWKLFEGCTPAVDGHIRLEARPGLGIELRRDVVADLEVR